MPTTPAQLTAAQSAAVVIKQSLNAVDVTTLTQADISLLLGDATTLLADVQAFTPAVIPSGALYSVFNNPLSPAQFQALTGQPTTIGMAFATVNQPSDIANIGKTLVRYLGGQSLANIIAPVNICTGAASKNSPGSQRAPVVPMTHISLRPARISFLVGSPMRSSAWRGR